MWKLKKDKASLENKIDLVSVTPKKEISVKKEGFFLSGKGGYPPPLNGKSAKLFREIFS